MESLVIVNHHVTLKNFFSFVHTARHVAKIIVYQNFNQKL